MSAPPVLLAVDGNSLLHRSYHALAGTGARTVTGEPVWAVRGLLTQVVAAADRVGPSLVLVGFDDPEHSRRRTRWPQYKAQRADKLPTLVSQLRLAAAVLRELGVHVVTPDGLEADDVLATAAARTAAAGGRTVLVTSDRDAFALIDERTSVLRVINGGVDASPLMTPDRLELLLGVRPHQYRDFAALRGDPSDNLPGVSGIGPKRAARLLAAFGTAEAVFDDVAAGGARVAGLVGPGTRDRLADPQARACWELNRAVMANVCDVELGLHPDRRPGRLPLSPDVVRRVLVGHGLPGTAKVAERCLSGLEPCHPGPPVPGDPVVDSLPWDARAEWRSRQTLPPLPTRPVDLQATLF
ncbi:5'-3' exonuclease [Desertihabitans brevis]|uniref:5'-3' exonuclease n=1 Tax=Desertihabitans brevis TaxID=2268447 RepID=UPI001F1754A6|nr:5'-3' exonuclease H3TH domain-containing protein [Desertihabitans brevis]